MDNTWTLVTGYFDLTTMSDASDAIRNRPAAHYLANATATLAIDRPMIVFCEPAQLEELKSRRPAHLHEKTRFVTMSFEDFPLTKYRDQLLENRKTNPSFDTRNTASYYLFCMSRYAMLKQAIQENPFGSTHFAWVNMCIQRMGPLNVRELEKVFSTTRDKFSTCAIDYYPPHQLDAVVRNGLCTLCSGFFTGRADYMHTFCNRIEEKFLECLNRKLGHADEQLFWAVYLDDPSIFELYYGDYTEMVTNYLYVKDRAHEVVRLFIAHSYERGGYEECLQACKVLWRSFKLGFASLSDRDQVRLIWFYRKSLEAIGLPPVLE
jgi:hypothetical protein